MSGRLFAGLKAIGTEPVPFANDSIDNGLGVTACDGRAMRQASQHDSHRLATTPGANRAVVVCAAVT